eukprot:3553183-Amphidinium_carterae.2
MSANHTWPLMDCRTHCQILMNMLKLGNSVAFSQPVHTSSYYCSWAVGLMDKASASGAGDSGFRSDLSCRPSRVQFGFTAF